MPALVQKVLLLEKIFKAALKEKLLRNRLYNKAQGSDPPCNFHKLRIVSMTVRVWSNSPITNPKIQKVF